MLGSSSRRLALARARAADGAAAHPSTVRAGSMSAVWVVLLVMAALATAALLGAAAGLGDPMLLVPFVAGGALIATLLVPVRWLVWTLVGMSFLVVGPAIYFARLEAARWLAPSLGILLTLPLLLGLLTPRERVPGGAALPASLRLYILFLVVLAFSTLLTSPRLAELLPAVRFYVAYLPLGLVIAFGFLGARDLERLWRFLLACAVIQLPVALYQAVVVAPRRVVQRSTWDAVSGTFPGNPEGGGANAAVSLFLLVAALIAISLWRAGFLRLRWMLAVALSSLAVILIGEVKAIALLIPVAFALLFARDLFRRPVLAVVGVAAGVILGATVLAVYQHTHFADRAPSLFNSGPPATPLESVQNQLDPQLHVRGLTAGRMFTFFDWAVRVPGSGKIAETLIGYGAGSTQVGRLGAGEVFEFLLYRVDITGSGLLLWEAGVLGHLLIIACFATAASAGFRLCRRPEVPAVHRAVLHAVAVGMVLHLLCLPYKEFHFSAAPSQVLLFLSLGYISFWQRTLGRSPASAPCGPPRSDSRR